LDIYLRFCATIMTV